MRVRFPQRQTNNNNNNNNSSYREASLPQQAIARLNGHDGPVSAVRFSKDGKYCLTASYDRSVRLWNPLRLDPAHPPTAASNTKETESSSDIPIEDLPQSLPIQVYQDGITHPVSAVAVDDASTTIVAASEKTVVIHDMVTAQCIRRLQGHVARINAVATTTDAQVYVSASYDSTVKLWDGRSKSFQPIQTLTHAKDSVTAVHIVQQPDLALVRTASVDGIVRTYDLRRGLLQCDNVHAPITGMCATSDQRGVLANCLDGALRLLDLDQGKMIRTYANGHVAGQYGLDCTVSAGMDVVATGSEDGTAALYDLKKGHVCQVLHGHRQPTCSVALHPSQDLSSVAITASFDGTAVVWGNDACLMQW